MGSAATYQGIKLIYSLNGILDVARVNGFPDLNPLLYGVDTGCGVDIGFGCEFLSGGRITFANQVVHDNGVEVSVDTI